MDECGNAYVDYAKAGSISDTSLEWVLERLDGVVDIIQDDTYFIYKDVYEKYAEYEVIISDDNRVKNYKSPRRPYYRMRGKPVTREQAFDIIRRTDNFFGVYVDDINRHKDFIGGMNFDNWLIMQNHYPQGYGWIHADGTVGSNAITQKYPTIEEYVTEWSKYLVAFPYLDLVVAVTGFNENPGWFELNGKDDSQFYLPEFDDVFYDSIDVGIYVHDKKIEILNKRDTIKKYKEYDKLYGRPREKFEPEYYGRNNISQIDEKYLRKCIESYGLDSDKILSEVGQNVWKRR